MIPKKLLLWGGSTLALIVCSAIVAGSDNVARPAEASHGGMDTMSIDMNTFGNSASSLGAADQCARINRNGSIDGNEATNVDISNPPDGIPDPDLLVIDVTAQNIPPYSNNGTPSNGADDSGGIVGYQYTFAYPSQFTVVKQESATDTVNLLASNPGSSIFSSPPVSEPLPDDEGTNYNTWYGAAIDTADPAASAPESGDGVLDRLVISADGSLSTGQYLLELKDNGHSDVTNGLYRPHTTGFANIAVNQACGGLVTSLGYYHPVTPKRILDTRPAPYGPIGVGSAGKVGSGGVLSVDVTNTLSSGVPASGVTAVVINTTVTEPDAPSHLTLYPSDVAAPNAANLNFVAGLTVPNLVTVKVGPDGFVKLRNNNGNTHVIFDIQGWYGAPSGGSRYNPITPKRILDTRPAPYGPIGVGSAGKIGSGNGAAITVDVTNTEGSGVPDTGVTAVVVNVTAVEPTASSHLTVYPSDAAIPPNAANLNFVAGQPPVPNLVTVKVGASLGGSVKVRNNSGNVHVIFDIVGWYGASSGGVFNPLSPKRILETRGAPYVTVGVPAAGKIGAGDGAVLTVDVTNTENSGVPEVPATTAVVVNTTVTEPTAPSHLTVFPSDVPPPNAANLNFIGGQTVPNLVVVKVGGDGKIKIRNNSGATHVIMDVAGYFGPVP